MLTSEEWDLLESIEAIHKSKLNVIDESESDAIHEILDGNLILGAYDEFYISHGYNVIHPNAICQLFILRVEFSFQNGKNRETDDKVRIIGMKQLNKSYGNIFLRPETLADKISEFFKRTEIDYKDYPVFSSKYFLQADHRSLCDEFATDKRLKLIEQQKEIFVQVKGDLLFAKYARDLNEADFASLIEFLKEI